jgi:protein TonB
MTDISTEPVLAEALSFGADTVAPLTQQVARVPHVVPARPPTGWIAHLSSSSRVVVAVSVSLASHAGVLIWLGYAFSVSFDRWIPVQDGHAAIELAAVMASPEQQAQPAEEHHAVSIDVPDRPLDLPVEPPAPASCTESIPVSVERCEIVDLPATERIDAVDVEATTPEDIRLCLSRVVREEFAPAIPAITSDDPSPLPRISPTSRTSVQVPVEPPSPVASPASPGSQAAHGAQSVPTVVHNPAPQYPPEALSAGLTGRVIVRVGIAADGSVAAADIHRSSGVRSLDQAALQAVRQWRFTPAESPATPFRRIGVPIRFVID